MCLWKAFFAFVAPYAGTPTFRAHFRIISGANGPKGYEFRTAIGAGPDARIFTKFRKGTCAHERCEALPSRRHMTWECYGSRGLRDEAKLDKPRGDMEEVFLLRCTASLKKSELADTIPWVHYLTESATQSLH